MSNQAPINLSVRIAANDPLYKALRARIASSKLRVSEILRELLSEGLKIPPRAQQHIVSGDTLTELHDRLQRIEALIRAVPHDAPAYERTDYGFTLAFDPAEVGISVQTFEDEEA